MISYALLRRAKPSAGGTGNSGPKSRYLVAVLVYAIMLALFALGPSVARVSDGEVFVEPNEPEFSAVRIAGPFEFPWSIAFLPDGYILVTERPGRLQLIGPDFVAQEVAGIPPLLDREHAGLLDVVPDPGFAENRIVYLSYVHGTRAASVMRVLRAKFDGKNRALVDQQVIFESSPSLPTTAQLGGRLAVTGDGYLFLTLGDRWRSQLIQQRSEHVGSIVRIHTDGSIPKDNPFVSLPGVRPEIWSYGHRNSQGLAIHPRTGQLWSHEHGPRGGDELNLIVAGGNYGWPVISHGLDYSDNPIGDGTAKQGMEQPVHHWTPAIAPSGLAIEDGGDGMIVFWIGALGGQALVRLELADGLVPHERRLLQDQVGRIRDVRIGPDGLLYLITDAPDGALYRLEPAVEQAARRGNRTRL